MMRSMYCLIILLIFSHTVVNCESSSSSPSSMLETETKRAIENVYARLDFLLSEEAFAGNEAALKLQLELISNFQETVDEFVWTKSWQETLRLKAYYHKERLVNGVWYTLVKIMDIIVHVVSFIVFGIYYVVYFALAFTVRMWSLFLLYICLNRLMEMTYGE